MARGADLTCGCHLSNIMPDSIFNGIKDSLVCFFCKGDNHCLPQHKRDGFNLIIITLTDLGKL